MPLEKLSLIMIVKNEEAHLGECLRQASGFVDEMVVVDTGSTDRTREIAAAAGALVAEFSWTGDFAAARNRSLELATGDWVLMLDADERMDDLNGVQLRRLLDGADPSLSAFCTRIESEARHHHSGVWLSHYYPRVFRRAAGVRFEGALHEQVIGPDGPLGLRAPRLPVVIRHLGYADAAKEAGRRDRNLAIIESEAGRRPGDVLVKRNLANALLAAGEHERARTLFQELVQADLPPDLSHQARWHLAMCCLELGRFDDTEQILSGMERSQGTVLLRAEGLRRSGRPESALPLLEGLLTDPPEERETSMDFRVEPAHLLVQMAHCERARGCPVRARERLLEALRLSPDSPEVHMELGMLAEDAGELEAALAHHRRALELHPYLSEAYRSRSRIRLLQGDAGASMAELEDGLAHEPGNAALVAMKRTLAARSPLGGPPAGTWPGLTLAMIVRDGAGSIGRAFTSVAGLADEVVVVDTGSADGTPELAEAADARVLRSAWNHDFAAARNTALEASRGEWVLFLDADEELDPLSASEVRAVLLGGEWDAAEVLIQNRLAGSSALSGIAHRYCRLFRKLPGVAFRGRVHEQILPSLIDAGARVKRTSIRILHSGYALDPASMRAKQERNLALLEREVNDHPQDGFIRFHLGVTLFALERRDEAARALRAALAGPGLPVEARALAHVKLAQVALASGRLPEAEADLAEARALRPGSPLVGYITAGLHFMRGEFAESASELERLVSRGDTAGWEEQLDEGDLRMDLGNCLYKLGRFEEAAAHYARAVELRPLDPRRHYNLGNALYRIGKFGPALVGFQEALRLDPGMTTARENAWECSLRLAESLAAEGRDRDLAGLDPAGGPPALSLLVAGGALRSGDAPRAAELLLECEKVDPCDAACRLLLAISLRQAGRLDESLQRFERLAAGNEMDAPALTQYALTLLDAGRETEAGIVFSRAVQLDPSLAGRAAA